MFTREHKCFIKIELDCCNCKLKSSSISIQLIENELFCCGQHANVSLQALMNQRNSSINYSKHNSFNVPSQCTCHTQTRKRLYLCYAIFRHYAAIVAQCCAVESFSNQRAKRKSFVLNSFFCESSSSTFCLKNV